MTESKTRKARIILILAMVIFGTVGIVRRLIPLSSVLLAFCRGIVGSLFLLFFMLVKGKKPFRGMRKKTLLLLLASGALIGFNWVALFEAYNYTTVTTATLCYYMAPIFMLLASPFVLKEKLSLKKCLCILMAFIGVALVTGITEGTLPEAGELKGILLGLLAALLYACVVMLNKKITGVDPLEKTFCQLGAAALVLLPVLPDPAAEFKAAAPVSAWILPFVILCVVITGLAYAMYFSSMENVPTGSVALLSYIDPLTALVLSVLVLGEALTAVGAVGAVLILGAALISER